MKTLIAYILVLPLSFVASRLGSIVVSLPIAFGLSRASVWFRSTIVGFIGSVGGVAAAVAVGWCIFSWLVGIESFTFFPFVASVLILMVSIPKDFRQSKQNAQTRNDLRTSGQEFLADEIGNPWSTPIGEIVGLILAFAWLILR